MHPVPPCIFISHAPTMWVLLSIANIGGGGGYHASMASSVNSLAVEKSPLRDWYVFAYKCRVTRGTCRFFSCAHSVSFVSSLGPCSCPPSTHLYISLSICVPVDAWYDRSSALFDIFLLYCSEWRDFLAPNHRNSINSCFAKSLCRIPTGGQFFCRRRVLR